MPWILLGALVGIIIGLMLNITIPIEYVKYTAVIIIGMLDSLLGAAKAEFSKERYDNTIFLTGLLFNILLALGISLLGEKLGLDLYIAVTVVFTFRIFKNLASIRRIAVKKIKNTKN